MSWSDTLKGSLGGILNQAGLGGASGAIESVLGSGGVQTLLTKLQQGGLNEHVASWTDQERQNLPVNAEQLRGALGSEYVHDLATKLGLPIDKLLGLLAEYLPQAAGDATESADQKTADSGSGSAKPQ